MALTFDLDESEDLSMSNVDLNNFLVSMRPLVKKAKIYTLRSLAKYIKKLKKKQTVAPVEKQARLRKKILNRLSEFRFIKKMATVRLCKLILSNELNSTLLSRNGHRLSKQERIIIRLSVCKQVADYVTEFRNKHNDWPTMIQYILYKNTSGKWKTRKQKRRSKRGKGEIPLPASCDSAKLIESMPSNICTKDNTIKRFVVCKREQDFRLLHEDKLTLLEVEDEENTAFAIADTILSQCSPITEQLIRPMAKCRIKHRSNENRVKNVNFSADLPVSDKDAILGDNVIMKLKNKNTAKHVKSSADLNLPDEEIVLGVDDVLMKPENKNTTKSVNSSADLYDLNEEALLGDDDVEMKLELKLNGQADMKLKAFSNRRQQLRDSLVPKRRDSAGVFSKDQSKRMHPNVFKDAADMHPSWKAMRDQKALLSSALSSAPTAKRIVFN